MVTYSPFTLRGTAMTKPVVDNSVLFYSRTIVTKRAHLVRSVVSAHLDQAGLIPESQCGFRKDRGTIDMIFTARQLQEKCQEQNVDLYMTFVDLTKAFDTVSRDGLWKIMAKFGCPPRYIAMVRRFMMACRHAFRMMESTLNHFR